MIEFFRSLQGFVVIGATALLAIWGWVASIKSNAVMKERAAVTAKGEVVSKKASSARAAATTKADELISRYYRD